ncbi:MAG: hypothetical protein R2685_11025 [Candidatus Nitrosocosmicus sp.]|nr:hypothetical protein [Candidatus Nitrosocosmicus sp.]
MSQLIQEQHEEIENIFTFAIYKDEKVGIIDELQYNRTQNTYRLFIKQGYMIPAEILNKLEKSKWKLNYIHAEEFVNYNKKPLPEIHVYLIVGLVPKMEGI